MNSNAAKTVQFVCFLSFPNRWVDDLGIIVLLNSDACEKDRNVSLLFYFHLTWTRHTAASNRWVHTGPFCRIISTQHTCGGSVLCFCCHYNATVWIVEASLPLCLLVYEFVVLHFLRHFLLNKRLFFFQKKPKVSANPAVLSLDLRIHLYQATKATTYSWIEINRTHQFQVDTWFYFVIFYLFFFQ